MKKLYKVSQIEAEIKRLESKGYRWFPVGGKENNAGIIEMTSIAGSAIAERITNAIDSVVEKNATPDKFLSPSEMVSVIEENGISMDNEVEVIIHEKFEKTMTLEILDRGTGVEESKMTSSILDLNSGNKNDKKYLMGAFGQGGSTSLKFNKYTIIYSRNQGNEIFTIIKYTLGDESTKTGVYEFLSLKKAEGFTFPSSNVLDSDGVSVINVQMEYSKNGNLRSQTNNIFSDLNNRLFFPSFTIKISDMVDKYSRPLSGARRMLENRFLDKSEKGVFIFKLSSGNSVKFNWWIVMPDIEEGKKDRSKETIPYYVKDARTPISLTLNGQTQGSVSRNWINDGNLSFLKNRMIGEVILDDINKLERKKLFSSTRESVNEKSDVLMEVKSRLINYFLNDLVLQKLNLEIKERLLKHEEDNSDFQKELFKNLKSIMNGFAKGKLMETTEISVLEGDQNGDGNERTDEIEMFDIPTEFSLAESTLKEYAGDYLNLRYITNGLKDSVIPAITVRVNGEQIMNPDIKQYVGTGKISLDMSEFAIGDNTSVSVSCSYIQGDFELNAVKVERETQSSAGFPVPNPHFITDDKNPLYSEYSFSKNKAIHIDYIEATNTLEIFFNLATYQLINSKIVADEEKLKYFKKIYAMSVFISVSSLIQSGIKINDIEGMDSIANSFARNAYWVYSELVSKKES